MTNRIFHVVRSEEAGEPTIANTQSNVCMSCTSDTSEHYNDEINHPFLSITCIITHLEFIRDHAKAHGPHYPLN